MATRKTRPTNAPTATEADHLARELCALGDYGHIVVRAERGHLLIAPDDDPVARLTPLGDGRYGLSFRTHTGRWEPMPFTGDLVEQAHTIVETLAPYLQRWKI